MLFLFVEGDGQSSGRHDGTFHHEERSLHVTDVGQQVRWSFRRVSHLNLRNDGHTHALQTWLGASAADQPLQELRHRVLGERQPRPSLLGPRGERVLHVAPSTRFSQLNLVNRGTRRGVH